MIKTSSSLNFKKINVSEPILAITFDHFDWNAPSFERTVKAATYTISEPTYGTGGHDSRVKRHLSKEIETIRK